MTKIKAKRIIIGFSESGLHQRRGYNEKNPKVFDEDCWTRAHGYLIGLAWESPKNGGYDKTDVTVEYEDGNTWEARLDLTHPDSRNPDHDLPKHILNFCRFYGGLVRDNELPSHLTPERYRSLLSRHPAEQATNIASFIEKYELPV